MSLPPVWLGAAAIAAALLAAWPLVAQDDSCQWPGDGECDEPGIGTGNCAAGTDDHDCRGPRAFTPNSCRSAFDGRCDEVQIGTGSCVAGTDAADCAAVVIGPNSCAYADDGECDEARYGGTGLCLDGTDTRDCTGTTVPGALGTAIQLELQRLGYEIGVVDGRVGPRVRVEIMEFQRQHGLLVTGQPTGALLLALRQVR